jgi:hypothetical protein
LGPVGVDGGSSHGGADRVDRVRDVGTRPSETVDIAGEFVRGTALLVDGGGDDDLDSRGSSS